MSTIYAKTSREDACDYMTSPSYTHNAAAAVFRIADLVNQCHLSANAMGWWLDPDTLQPKGRNFGELISLIHSELSEALEGDRKNLASDKLPGFTSVEEELADVLVRVFDLSGAMELRLGEAFQAKMKYNQTREDHKLEARAAADGKKF